MIEKNNKFIRAIIKLINVLMFIAIVPCIMMFVISPMIFDAPNSGGDFVRWIFFISTFTSPFVIVISINKSSKIMSEGRNGVLALFASLLPLLNVLGMWLATKLEDYSDFF